MEKTSHQQFRWRRGSWPLNPLPVRSSLLPTISASSPQSGEGTGFGSDVVRVSVDNSDIQAIERRIETRFQAAQGDAFGTQWRDEGFWLLLPVALLSLLWFRRGTTVAWGFALFMLMSQAPPASAQEASRFADWWLTPDQQGRLAFDRGDYAVAAKRFAD